MHNYIPKRVFQVAMMDIGSFSSFYFFQLLFAPFETERKKKTATICKIANTTLRNKKRLKKIEMGEQKSTRKLQVESKRIFTFQLCWWFSKRRKLKMISKWMCVYVVSVHKSILMSLRAFFMSLACGKCIHIVIVTTKTSNRCRRECAENWCLGGQSQTNRMDLLRICVCVCMFVFVLVWLCKDTLGSIEIEKRYVSSSVWPLSSPHLDSPPHFCACKRAFTNRNQIELRLVYAFFSISLSFATLLCVCDILVLFLFCLAGCGHNYLSLAHRRFDLMCLTKLTTP